MEKFLEAAWAGHINWVGRCLRESPGQDEWCKPVNREQIFGTHLCLLVGWVEGSKKEQGQLPLLLSLELPWPLYFIPHSEASQVSSTPCIPDAF